MKCELDAEGHCITCSDEATAATVQRVDQETGIAFVTINGETEEVDITLIDDVSEGDLILVHGGVAIGIASSAVILSAAKNPRVASTDSSLRSE